MCFTETHLDDVIPNASIFECDNKTIYRKDRNTHGGGVMIAINPDITHHEINLSCQKEVVGVVLPPNGQRKGVVVLCIYNPPGSDIFSDEFHWLDDLYHRYPHFDFLLTGDFNMPDIDWRNNVVRKNPRDKLIHLKFLNTTTEFNLQQLVMEPTHVLGNTLDLVLSSDPTSVQDLVVTNPGFSDHYSLSFVFSGSYIANVEPPKDVKIYDKADLESISTILSDTVKRVNGLIAEKENIDTVWQCFQDNLDMALTDHIPTKKISGRNSREPFWFNKEARNIVNKQRKVYNKYKKTKCVELLSKYKIMRKENKKALYFIKKEYMQKFLFAPLAEGDSKPFYSHMKRVRGDRSKIKSMQDNSGNIISSPFLISNVLNDYFYSVFSSNSPVDSTCDKSKNSDVIVIERKGVLELIKNLKASKAPGPDKIQKRDLILVPEITDILTSIFQYSMDTATLPTQWKLANVVPVHKSGGKVLPGNYRPVSLTSNVCKMLEHIVLHYFNQHLENILCTNQHGFRRGASCNTQLITALHQILQLVDNGNLVQVAALDFAKAFDKVSHSILIEKLHKFNIPLQLVNWIENFLTGRQQQVVMDGTVSNMHEVRSGVPQGTVLGPSLFLFYINDIVDNIGSGIRLFADDIIIYSIVKDETDIKKFQEDISKLEDWANKSDMSFNVKKCNIMYMGKNRNINIEDINYTLNQQVIKRVESIKYLGVVLTSNLKWESHINAVVNKAMRTLGLIKHTLFNADVKIKLLAYKTLCRPLLEYASASWDPYLKKDVESLEMVQKRAVRFISGLKGVVSISDETQKIGLDTLESRRKNSRMLTLLKILENEALHPILVDFFNNLQTSEFNLVPNTRASGKGHPKAPRINCDQFLNSFMPRTMRDFRGE